MKSKVTNCGAITAGIGIHKLKPQLARHHAAYGGFPTAHETNESKVMDGAWVRHRRTVPYWRKSKK